MNARVPFIYMPLLIEVYKGECSNLNYTLFTSLP